MADKTKNYKTGFYCFSAKHAALRSKSKDWLDRNTNNVFEWDDMSNSRSCPGPRFLSVLDTFCHSQFCGVV
jgi:hypothetical protein